MFKVCRNQFARKQEQHMLPSLLFARVLHSDVFTQAVIVYILCLAWPTANGQQLRIQSPQTSTAFLFNVGTVPHHNFEQRIINLCMIDGARL
jgi:hypothetical protein